jgi:hypothetical protein
MDKMIAEMVMFKTERCMNIISNVGIFIELSMKREQGIVTAKLAIASNITP